MVRSPAASQRNGLSTSIIYNWITIEIMYPFREGDRYFTIEDNRIIESVWDDVSEEIYDASRGSGKMYFDTAHEAFLHLRLTHYGYMLSATEDALRQISNGANRPKDVANNILECLSMKEPKILFYPL